MTNYVEGGLAEFAPPPYVFRNLTSATFFLDANKPRLEEICDRFLNRPLQRAAGDEFEPAGNNLALTCSTFPVAESPTVPVGYTQYCEIALMFSVYDRKLDQWGWFAPVLYLDGPAAGDEEWQPALPIAIGRELYGLAKRRAEISLDTADYTGTLATIGFGAPGEPAAVRQVLRIHLGSEVEASTLDRRIQSAEHRLICSGFRRSEEDGGPAASPFDLRGNAETEQLRKRRHIAKARSSEEKRTAQREAGLPDEQRHPVSSEEFMTKVWGESPYDNVAPHKKVKPPSGKKLLDKLGLPSQAKGAEAYRNWIDFHMLGFRQLRDPQDLSRADVQQVIRTKMSFDRLPWPVIREYFIEINGQSDFARVLGLESQRVRSTDVFEYRNAEARFGETSTVVD